MPDPTVKVTISAQDQATAVLQRVQQELNALKGVTANVAQGLKETGAAAQASTPSFLGMVSAVKQLAVAYGALKVVDFVGSVIESTAATGRLAQITGVSTEKLSVLKVAAEENGVAFDDMNAGLRRFATAMGNLETGKGGKIAEDLKAIGLSAKDLQGLPLDQQLLKVVNAMAKYADGTDKMAVANALFGRSGSALLPMFDALANDGFDKIQQKAEETGQVISTEAGKQAIEFSAQLKELKGSLEGLARAVLESGLLTALTKLVDLLSGAVNLLRESGPTLGVFIPALGAMQQAEALKQQALAAQQKTAPAARAGGDTRLQIHLGDAAGTSKDDQERLAALQAAAQQRLALVRQEATEEFASFQSFAKLGEQIEAARYAQGLVALDAYFALRRKAITDAYAAEQQDNAKQIAAIEQATASQVRALRAAPVNPTLSADAQGAERSKHEREARTLEAAAAREIEAIKAKGSEEQIAAQTEVVQLTEEERLKRQAILDQVTALHDKILAARGDTRAVAQSQIDKEVRDAGVTLGQAGGLSPAQIVQQQADLKQTLQLQADFTEAQRQAAEVQKDVQTQKSVIDEQVRSGLISQKEGEQQLLDLEKSRAPALEAIAQKMAAIAEQLGNKQLAQEAATLSANIATMGKHTDDAAVASANLGDNIAKVAQSGLVEYFASGINRVNGFNSALVNVVGQIQQLIAKALVLQAIKILGLGGAGGDAGGATAVSGGLGAALAAGAFAAGGVVRGPGTATSDSVPAWLSAGELVVTAEDVQRNGGAEQLWGAIKAGGLSRLAPQTTADLPRFAQGGVVTHTHAAGGVSRSEVLLRLDRGLYAEFLRSTDGHRLIIEGLDKNPKAARRAMRLPG